MQPFRCRLRHVIPPLCTSPVWLSDKNVSKTCISRLIRCHMRVQVQQFAKETHSSVQHATGRAGCAGSITEHLGTRTCLSAGSSRFVAVSTTCNAVFPCRGQKTRCAAVFIVCSVWHFKILWLGTNVKGNNCEMSAITNEKSWNRKKVILNP